MTMRKKDYEAIARLFDAAISQHPFEPTKLSPQRCALAGFALDIADYCATQDPTFKRDRFLADCGVNHD